MEWRYVHAMPRNFLIQIKVTEQEKDQIRNDAERMQQNTSEYVRSLLLHKKDSLNEILDPPQPSEFHNDKITTSKGNSSPTETGVEEGQAVFEKPEGPTHSPATNKLLAGSEFKRLVAKHKLKMGTKAAESLARKELEDAV